MTRGSRLGFIGRGASYLGVCARATRGELAFIIIKKRCCVSIGMAFFYESRMRVLCMYRIGCDDSLDTFKRLGLFLLRNFFRFA